MELKGKVAVITGASSGIGEGTARELADAGMKLVLTARRKRLLDKIAAQLDTEVAIIAGDITGELLPQKLMDRLMDWMLKNSVRYPGSRGGEKFKTLKTNYYGDDKK